MSSDEGDGDDDDSADGDEYCDAEVLYWVLDGEELSVLNTRVMLNCCGEHSITVSQDGDGDITVREVDRPAQPGYKRCFCSCNYDFRGDASGIEAGQVNLILERKKTDDSATFETLWEGQVDLAEGSGQIVVDDVPADAFCSAP